MMTKRTIWTAIAGLSAILTLGIVAPASAQNYNNNNGRHSRNYNHDNGNHNGWTRRQRIRYHRYHRNYNNSYNSNTGYYDNAGRWHRSRSY